ncbi:hypothetical protein TSUD_322140, partial [Trifolium subterraneum]
MRIKSVVTGGRRRSITPRPTPSISPIPDLSTAQDNHNATVYDSDTSKDNHTHAPIPDFVPDTDTDDSLDDNSCVTCNKAGGVLLVCTQTDCPIVVHVNCIGSEPNFGDSGNFSCPYCSYKRELKKTKELREKAVRAKNVLSSFLDKGQTVHKDSKNCPVKPEVYEKGKEHNDNDKDKHKGEVSVSGSSVAAVKKSLLPERKAAARGDDGEQEEVTSSRRTISRRKQVKKQKLFTVKRRKLFWTAEEEKALEEGVAKFSTENQDIPWRKILEFGCRVFDSTRTPVDLKDKWRNMKKE